VAALSAWHPLHAESVAWVAERACELTGHKRAQCLATLAAAYAEARRFADAISTVETAQRLAASTEQNEVAARCCSRLKNFKSERPWREGAYGYCWRSSQSQMISGLRGSPLGVVPIAVFVTVLILK